MNIIGNSKLLCVINYNRSFSHQAKFTQQMPYNNLFFWKDITGSISLHWPI